LQNGYKWTGEQDAAIKAMWEFKSKELLIKIMLRARENVREKPKWITEVA
jgi:hypothetical protein